MSKYVHICTYVNCGILHRWQQENKNNKTRFILFLLLVSEVLDAWIRIMEKKLSPLLKQLIIKSGPRKYMFPNIFFVKIDID